jgi:opacity protein-like surface antigen
MKKLLLLATFAVAALTQVNAQDKLKKHSGETLDVKVIKVSESTITFKYPGEDAEQVIGKLAVANITYSSGRKEEMSEKVMVSGKDDWEKVQIITDASMVMGLKKGEEVRGKTSGILSYHTAGSADKKATRKIKEAAAEMGAPFVLMASDKSDNFGVKQSIKNGVTYSYK